MSATEVLGTVQSNKPGGSRVVRALRRWRLDGRLPEPTTRSLEVLVRLGTRRYAQRFLAWIVPPAGLARGWWSASVIDGQWRRWQWGGVLEAPLDDLAHCHANEVKVALERNGVDCVLVGYDGYRVNLGVDAEDRQQAVIALGGLSDPGRWYVVWRRGRRQRVARLGTWSFRHRAGRAESWEVFRWARGGRHYGEGRRQAVLVTFWATGVGGRWERLGLRGLNRFDVTSERTNEVLRGHRYPGRSAIPVGRALGRLQEPVDVVFTWVDGADPEWQEQFAEWSVGLEPAGGNDYVHPARYRSYDELRYSLRSVWLYAGWVRRIYLVTAGHLPDWLVPDERLRVVTHDEIFPGEWLPTFNSHAIEARLHHIPGLAEHFVYLNDDVFLAKQLAPEAFFTPNGLPLFTESAARVEGGGGTGAETTRSVDEAARTGQGLIRRDFGVEVAYKLDHAPHPLRRSTLAQIEQRYPREMAATASHRFRHPDDLAVASGFAAHYGYCTGSAVPGGLSVGYENLGGRRLGWGLRRYLWGRDLDAICLNATEVWERSPAEVERKLSVFLEEYFPVPSPWEKDPTLTPLPAESSRVDHSGWPAS